MSDLLRTIAFAYRRKGELAMPSNALRLMLAFDLNWFAPADAKRAVERAVAGGLLVAEEGGEVLAIAFDPAAVDVPVGFRPTPDVLEEPFPALPAAPPPRASPPAAAPAPAAPAAPADEELAALLAAEGAPAAPDGAGERADEPVAETLEAQALAERDRWHQRLSLDVARLVVRRRRGEDVAPLLEEAERALLAAPPQKPGGSA